MCSATACGQLTHIGLVWQCRVYIEQVSMLAMPSWLPFLFFEFCGLGRLSHPPETTPHPVHFHCNGCFSLGMSSSMLHRMDIIHFPNPWLWDLVQNQTAGWFFSWLDLLLYTVGRALFLCSFKPAICTLCPACILPSVLHNSLCAPSLPLKLWLSK